MITTKKSKRTPMVKKKPKIVHFDEGMIQIDRSPLGKPILYIWKNAESTGWEIGGKRKLRKLARAILAEVGE